MLRTLLHTTRSTARRTATVSSLAKRTFADYPPHEVVGLPALSPTMDTGNLAKWNKKEGEQITPGDVICQVETDKAVMDFEAQDEYYLAKILVPEGAEGIEIGAPIMVVTDSEDNVSGLANFELDESSSPSSEPKQERAPEETPPKKEEVSVDPETKEPVSPSDFLVTSQTTHKNEQGPSIPESPPQQEKPQEEPQQHSQQAPASAIQVEESWGQNVKKSPLFSLLTKKQQEYVDMYGPTGTSPVASDK